MSDIISIWEGLRRSEKEEKDVLYETYEDKVE
jgi:hypothetical protein